MTEVVPAEFIFCNTAGAETLYSAVRNASGFMVKFYSGDKSGLGEQGKQYPENQVWSYLYGTRDWHIVEVKKQHSFVSTLSVKTEFWAGLEFKGQRYEVNSVEEACKLLGTMRALLKLEENLARKRRT